MSVPLAFYAPLKPPDHLVASGDRTIARLLVQALAAADFGVQVASAFRSFEGRGDRARQRALRQAGRTEARQLVARLACLPRAHRPAVWFSYHLYHKAPDWIGPLVARALGIPYVLAEASYARKQARGPWSHGLAGTRQAITQAACLLSLNPRDVGGLITVRGGIEGIHTLRPFLDTGPFAGPRQRERAALAEAHGLDPAVPWLISVGMLRRGDKLASFERQARVLASLTGRPWHWLIIGDGDAAADVDRATAPITARVTRLGALPQSAVSTWLRNSDLAVWPAINEAIGMALLEAQAAGLPVVAGHTDGVAAVCDNAGCSVVPQTEDALTTALAQALDHRGQWAAWGAIARASVPGIAEAGATLRRCVAPLVTGGTPPRRN
ncbi:MAG: glycosyltransferase family 4 protein [Pseudomonadota bacterium]